MNEIITAPIAVFCYNRVDVMKVLFQTLKKNTLSKESEVYIFCDGPKSSSVKAQTDEVRKFVHSIDGFKSMVIEENDTNRGLAPSIIYGVSKVLEKHDRVIVLEDDLILSTNFLEWMNQCLNKYRNNTDVFSVSGFTPSIMKAYSGESPDSLFTMKAHSWGWATWKDRWEQVDWELKDWDEFSKSKKKQKEFATIGNEMPGLLFAHKEGKKAPGGQGSAIVNSNSGNIQFTRRFQRLLMRDLQVQQLIVMYITGIVWILTRQTKRILYYLTM